MWTHVSKQNAYSYWQTHLQKGNPVTVLGVRLMESLADLVISKPIKNVKAS